MTTLIFQTLTGASLSTTLLEIENSAPASLSIRVALPFEGWTRLQADALFHPWFEEDTLPIFERVREIFLTLRLTPALTPLVTSEVTTPEALLFLAASHVALLHTQSWLLLAATQAVPLPADLQSPNAMLNVGAATQWQRLLNGTPALATPPNDVIRNFFHEHEWVYEELNPTLWRLTIEGDADTWIVLVQLNTEDQLCSVYSIFPEEVEAEEKRPAVAAYLMGVNCDLALGSWEMDLGDGEIRFRTSLDYEGDELTTALFTQLMMMNIHAAEAEFEAIRAQITG